MGRRRGSSYGPAWVKGARAERRECAAREKRRAACVRVGTDSYTNRRTAAGLLSLALKEKP